MCCSSSFELQRRLQRNKITTIQRPLLVLTEDYSSNQLDMGKGTEYSVMLA